jgi:hypothetical protein
MAVRETPNCRSAAPRLYRISLLWRARLEAKAGRTKNALSTLDEAALITMKEIPGYSPIQMTEILGEKLRLGIATLDEVQTLHNYPCLPAWETELLNHAAPEPTEAEPIPRASIAPTSWWISPNSDEYLHEGVLRTGIPLEISLLRLLGQAGKYGIHRNLAMALLWPEQWMLLPQLDERLTKLTKRLRTEHDMDIIVENDCLFLAEHERKRVIVDRTRETPTFFDALGSNPAALFGWQQIAEHYSMKATPARDLIARWIEKSLISKEGAGPSTRYRIL